MSYAAIRMIVFGLAGFISRPTFHFMQILELIVILQDSTVVFQRDVIKISEISLVSKKEKLILLPSEGNEKMNNLVNCIGNLIEQQANLPLLTFQTLYQDWPFHHRSFFMALYNGKNDSQAECTGLLSFYFRQSSSSITSNSTHNGPTQ